MARESAGSPLPWLDAKGVLRSEFSDAMGRTAHAAKRHPMKGAILAREIWETDLGENERRMAQSLAKDPDALTRFVFCGIDNAGFVPELGDWRTSARQKQLLFELRRVRAKERAKAEGEALDILTKNDRSDASGFWGRHAKKHLNTRLTLALGGVAATAILSPQIPVETAVAGFVGSLILVAASFAPLPAPLRSPARLWGSIRDDLKILGAHARLKAAWPQACVKNQRAACAHWRKNGAEKAAFALSRLPVGMDSPSRRRALSNAMMQCLEADDGAPAQLFVREAERVMQSVSLEGFGERMARREKAAIANEWAETANDAHARSLSPSASSAATVANSAGTTGSPNIPRRL